MELDDSAKWPKLGQYITDNYIDRKNGMTLLALANKLGISRQLLYLVMTGKQPLSPALAMQLSATLGNSIDFWLKLNEIDNIKNDYPDYYQGKSREEVLLEWARMGSRTLVDKDIASAIKRQILILEPNNNANIHAVGYNLRIGQKAIFSDLKKTNSVDLNEDQIYYLDPGAVVTLSSYEKITLPKFLLGRFNPTRDLSAFGIITSQFNTLEPGFCGHIGISLFNPGANRFAFYHKSPFISLEFIYVPLEPYFFNMDQSSSEQANIKDIKKYNAINKN
jgi:deoxycytidine triphosphate deaminase/plasmid maintenance system antidote protein VapI